MIRNLLGKKIKTFNIIKLVGQGQTGAVFQALDDNSKEIVAVKVIYRKRLSMCEKLKRQIECQVSVLKKCRNQNVIQFIDSFQTNQYFFIVTEYCNNGNLGQYMQFGRLTEDEAVNFLKQILNGFKGIHEVGAMHRDLKAENLLIHNGVCKIADLGSSKQMNFSQMTKTFIGTPMTNAPEVLQQKQYGFEADIWSIGIVFYQMIFGDYPFTGNSIQELLKNIRQKQIKFDPQINNSREAKNFIQRCLVVNPKQRIEWKQIYDHPLLDEKNNEVRLLTNGLMRMVSFNTMDRNKSFYQKSGILDSGKLQKIIEECTNQSTQVVNQVDIKPSDLLSFVMHEAQDIKKSDDVEKKFDSLYTAKRNDLMFFNKFIYPHLSNLSKLQINHSVFGFVMSKKFYIELSKFYEQIVTGSAVFMNQSGLENYIKLQSYDKMMKQVNRDMQKMQETCKHYKQQIKITSVEIMNQIDYTTTRSQVLLQKLTKQISFDYLKFLLKHIQDTDQETKISIIKVIEAISYYNNSIKPSSEDFDRIITSANISKLEKSIRSKYKIFL